MLPHPFPWQVAYAVAITVVFVRGSLFDPLRERGPSWWRDLASCPLCSGVWIGAGLHLAAAFAARSLPAAEPHAVVAFGLETLGVGALTGTLALGASLLLSALDKLSD